MNEEIKEILEDIQKFVNGDTWVKYFVASDKKIIPETYAMNFNTTKKILDYITNLQEENQKLNKIIDGIENYLKVGIAMNFNMNNNKFSEQTVDNYNDILNKLTELKKEVE